VFPIVPTRRLLALAAALEAVTGLALVVAPPVVARLLLGADVAGVGAIVGRVAGCALVALGLACWPFRDAASRPAPALRAMLAYNLLVTCYLVFLGIGGQDVGVLLWPVAAVHGLLSLLFIVAWLPAAPTQDAKN
jgi:hypothetical protein